jgi:hypothetical protein
MIAGEKLVKGMKCILKVHLCQRQVQNFGVLCLSNNGFHEGLL